MRGRVVVSRLFTEGASGFIFPLRYVWSEVARESEAAEGVEATNKILFTVPKRFHKRANKRNLLRRRVKEAYRLNKELLPVGECELRVSLAYSNKEILEFDHIERAVKRVLKQIAIESGRSKTTEE